jgi:DNA-binding NarL/FixJ family response regulator
MVGRDAELGQLLRLLGVHTGGSVALIGGEPGIGKTRLVSELLGALPPRSTVLIGQADPGTLSHPYHLLIDLVSDGGPPGAELATLTTDDLSPQERQRTAVELLRGALPERETTVLVVDDLHWADPESVAVIERLVESATGRLLMVATYRPEALTHRHPVAELVQRLDRRHNVVHLRLERLAQSDVASFLAAVYGHAPSHRAAGRLHQRTGGNPFFLEELLKASGETDPDRISVQPLPWTLAEALRSQLDDLEPEHRRVVEAAAVLGARVSFDLLAAVTGLAEPELIAMLRDLVGRGLMVENDEDVFGFRHALTREVIAGEMLGRERRRLHEAALDQIRRSENPDLAAIAVHAKGAGRYADMVAAARQGSAARLAASSPYAALKLAELGLEEEPEDAELLATAANAAWLAGYYEDAERHADRWLHATGDAGVRSAALRLLVRLAWETKDFKAMDGRVADVAEVIERLPYGEERAQAYAAIAQSHMLRNQYPEAIEWANRAAQAADRLNLPEVRLSALVEKGTALLYVPDGREAAEAMLTAVADEAERIGAYVVATRAMHNLFWQTRSTNPALPGLLERMRADSERAGLGGNFASSYHDGLSWLAVVAGDLDGAITALEDVERLGYEWSPYRTCAMLAGLYLERGDLDRAEAALRETPTERAPHWVDPEALGMQLACWRGDLGRARRELAELTAVLAGEELVLPDVLLDVLSAGLAGGLSVDELAGVVEIDGALRATGSKIFPDPPDHPLRRALAAQLAEARGRRDEALADYLALAQSTHHDAIGHRRATAWAGAARCLIALNRQPEARAAVQAGAAALERWPGWRRAELEVLARRLGVTLTGEAPSTPPTVSSGPGALTPREREVAALLAEGLTNSELARRLVISRKTAAVHVSNILAKLGMSSRAQVAAWVTREGMD